MDGWLHVRFSTLRYDHTRSYVCKKNTNVNWFFSIFLFKKRVYETRTLLYASLPTLPCAWIRSYECRKRRKWGVIIMENYGRLI